MGRSLTSEIFGLHCLPAAVSPQAILRFRNSRSDGNEPGRAGNVTAANVH
jgi:hypothetical protein